MFSCGLHKCVHLSARGEHGRRLGEDATSRRRGLFRRRLPGGLAGQPNEEEVSGLEEEAAARQTVRNTEEAGLGVNGKVKLVELNWEMSVTEACDPSASL